MTGVLKYLKPSNYVNRLGASLDAVHRGFYARFIHDKKALQSAEDLKFEQMSLNLPAALQALNRVLQQVRGSDFDFDDDSIHWLLFSAISISGRKIGSILEIGTFDGEFTAILARLFPQSKISTVDLPASDPLLRDFYNREEDSDFQRYKKKQAANLANKNITLIESNSFFLLDRTSEKFDLIWVDGGHLYPEVAWDLCSAYYLCKAGGYLLCDDVIPMKKLFKDRYVSTESFEVLKYLEARVAIQLAIFLKRRKPSFYARSKSRKYVALLRKPSADPGLL